MTFNDFWNDYKKDLTNKEQIEIALDAWSAGVNSIRAEKLVSPTEPNDGEIKRFISSQKQLDPDIISLLNEFDELTGKRKPSRDRFI